TSRVPICRHLELGTPFASTGSMRQPIRITALLTAAFLAASVPAATALGADEPAQAMDRSASPDSSKPAIGVFGNAGLFSPVGFAGLTVACSLDRIVLESGVGFGMSGLQISVMPKLRLGGGDRGGWFLGIGPSAGIGVRNFGFSRPGRNTLWLNAEVGYE